MSDNQGESYYIQVSDSIKSIYELTTRVDERQQLMMTKVEQLEQKLDSQLGEYRDLEGRIRVIESKDGTTIDVSGIKDSLHDHDKRLQVLEITSKSQKNVWSYVFNFAANLGWVIIASYLLYKFGLQSPDLP